MLARIRRRLAQCWHRWFCGHCREWRVMADGYGFRLENHRHISWAPAPKLPKMVATMGDDGKLHVRVGRKEHILDVH